MSSFTKEGLAKIFCVASHESIGQRRKYTNEHYWVHPINVAKIVKDNLGPLLTPFGEDILCAAYLHDVLEDTNVSEETLRSIFGDCVCDIVVQLTDTSSISDGNRKIRKSIDRERLKNASSEAQTIKYADLIDNTSTICRYDKGFAKIYLIEKKMLLDVMDKGIPDLRNEAYLVLKDALEMVGMTLKADYDIV